MSYDMNHDTDEMFAALESGFRDIDLDDSLESVIARGRRLRDRRRMRTGLAATGVAAIAALAVALPSTSGGSSARDAGVNVQMAGWSVHTDADAKVTLTMHDLADPDQVRKVLAEAGITAHVRVEKVKPGTGIDCEPPSWKDYVPEPNIDNVPLSVTMSGGTFTAIIDPALMPKGAVFSLIIFDEGASGHGFSGSVFKYDAPVTCVTFTAPHSTSTSSNPTSSLPPNLTPSTISSH